MGSMKILAPTFPPVLKAILGIYNILIHDYNFNNPCVCVCVYVCVCVCSLFPLAAAKVTQKTLLSE